MGVGVGVGVGAGAGVGSDCGISGRFCRTVLLNHGKSITGTSCSATCMYASQMSVGQSPPWTDETSPMGGSASISPPSPTLYIDTTVVSWGQNRQTVRNLFPQKYLSYHRPVDSGQRPCLRYLRLLLAQATLAWPWTMCRYQKYVPWEPVPCKPHFPASPQLSEQCEDRFFPRRSPGLRRLGSSQCCGEKPIPGR